MLLMKGRVPAAARYVAVLEIAAPLARVAAVLPRAAEWRRATRRVVAAPSLEAALLLGQLCLCLRMRGIDGYKLCFEHYLSVW